TLFRSRRHHGVEPGGERPVRLGQLGDLLLDGALARGRLGPSAGERLLPQLGGAVLHRGALLLGEPAGSGVLGHDGSSRRRYPDARSAARSAASRFLTDAPRSAHADSCPPACVVGVRATRPRTAPTARAPAGRTTAPTAWCRCRG